MNISTKGRYGLRLMLELGINYNKGFLSTKQIAKNQDISIKYLEQIIGILSKAALIKTLRGANGGHSLAKPPEEYTVYEILTVLEGSLSPVECVDNQSCCNRQSKCLTFTVWEKISKAIKEVTSDITLKDLLDQAKGKDIYDYYI